MTSALTIKALPYSPTPLEIFAHLRKRHGAVLLDSGTPHTNGRYDIISSDPLATLEVMPDGQTHFTSTQLDLPSALAGDMTAQQQWMLEQLPSTDFPSELLF